MQSMQHLSHSDLNAAQKAAVTSPANVVQVLAPPGSGKTKTLTSRVLYMLQELQYEPGNIICLTFTIKSAREMRNRISKAAGEHVERKLMLGTFHSVCRRYLTEYGRLIGIDKGFGIADTSDTLSIIKRIVKRRGLNIDPSMAQSCVSRAKAKGLSSEDLERKLGQKRDVERQEIVTVFEDYQSHLRLANLLDYDDLLVRCAELLERHPMCVSKVEAVLIDEFQDTNTIQFELMRLFAAHRERVTTVGDPDQSIYGWRSAEVKNLARMRLLFPEIVVINLQENYRSSGAILLAAQEVIEQDDARPPKSVSPTQCPGTVPVLRTLPSAYTEASWIASEVLRLRGLTGQLLEYEDFAILLRSASLSRLIESALNRENIPYRMVGGQRFFDRAEIKILLDYLRIISQPGHNDALARILNIPHRGIGVATAKGLLEEAESRGLSLWSLIRGTLDGSIQPLQKVSRAAQQGLGTLNSILSSCRSKIVEDESTTDPEQLLRLLIKKLDFLHFLQKTYATDHDTRWANVEELVTQAAEYPLVDAEESLGLIDLDDTGLISLESINPATEALSKFLGNVALMTEPSPPSNKDDASAPPSMLTVSTIHAAKGLEWPVVFVPSIYEGCIPHSRAEDTDEERRLLYVGMTRAQGMLYMSWPVRTSQHDEAKLSRFVSTKKVQAYLSIQGPTVDTTAVTDLARILRRPCPPPDFIEAGGADLRSRFDDMWPLKEEDFSQFSESKREQGAGHNAAPATSFGDRGALFASRNNISMATAGSGSTIHNITFGQKTTMQNTSAFSTASANLSFKTAAEHLQTQKDASSRTLLDRDQRKPPGRPKKPAVLQQAQERKRDLLSMWGLTGSGEPQLRGKENAAPTAEDEVNLSPPSGLSSTSYSTDSPGLPIKAEQPSKSLRDSSVHREPPEGPDNVSWAAAQPHAQTPDMRDPIQPFKKPCVAQEQSKLNKASNTASSRKTLGVRRSMQGWSVAVNRSMERQR